MYYILLIPGAQEPPTHSTALELIIDVGSKQYIVLCVYNQLSFTSVLHANISDLCSTIER